MYWQMKISMLVGYAQNIAVENTKTLTKNTSLLKKWRLQELIISSGLTNYLVLANWYWLVFNCISFVKQPSEESSINTAFFLKSTHLVSKNISSKHVIPTFNTVPESWPSGCAFLKSLIPFYQMLNFFFFFKVWISNLPKTSVSSLPAWPARLICLDRNLRKKKKEWRSAMIGSGLWLYKKFYGMMTSVYKWLCRAYLILSCIYVCIYVCTKWKWQISGTRSLGPPFGPLDFVKFAKPNKF